ncbi:MAG: hypothetical protein OXC01_16595 [Immundisolibacterales bacterium]|nr:hypothetical protein [Immundisolibacterales bacterium]
MPEPNPQRLPGGRPSPSASGPTRYCYIDLDGCFASAEQHLRPELRGLPVGVHAGTPEHRDGTLISVSPEAKAKGIKTGMRSREARRVLPSLRVLAQRPVEYIRLHHALVACIDEVAPVQEVHSVDEVSIALAPSDDPTELMHALREAVTSTFSPALSFSAGVASSIWLAKVAAERGKGAAGERGGAVDWTIPGALPDVLFELELEDLPKVGARKAARLRRYGIESVRDFYDASLSRVGDAFGSVDGERIWLAMHGYDVRWTTRKTPKSLSHSRVLARSTRDKAEPIARWLALCGWLRARGAGLRPRGVRLEGKVGERLIVVLCVIPYPGGEREALGATSAAWRKLRDLCLPERITVILDDLAPDPWQYADLLEGADTFDRPIDKAFAEVRERYGVRAIQRGVTGDPTGPFTGLKISFDRVPSLEEVALFCGGHRD